MLKYPQSVIDYCCASERKTIAQVIEKYNARATVTWEEISNYIPTAPISMLDIGCGIGATTSLVAQMSGAMDVHLIDGEGSLKLQGSFNPEGTTAWNDVRLAKTMVQANVDNDVTVTMHMPNPQLDFVDLDLIVSFRSWCHHYPADTYLKLAQRGLREGGTLIVDVRAGTDGEQVLLAGGFTTIAHVNQNSTSPGKCRRLVLRR
jgi:SAM-dependent methyltransferase